METSKRCYICTIRNFCGTNLVRQMGSICPKVLVTLLRSWLPIRRIICLKDTFLFARKKWPKMPSKWHILEILETKLQKGTLFFSNLRHKTKYFPPGCMCREKYHFTLKQFFFFSIFFGSSSFCQICLYDFFQSKGTTCLYEFWAFTLIHCA